MKLKKHLDNRSVLLLDDNVVLKAANGEGIAILDELLKFLNGEDYSSPQNLRYVERQLTWVNNLDKPVLFNLHTQNPHEMFVVVRDFLKPNPKNDKGNVTLKGKAIAGVLQTDNSENILNETTPSGLYLLDTKAKKGERESIELLDNITAKGLAIAIATPELQWLDGIYIPRGLQTNQAPASLTKILTCLLAIESNISLQTAITVLEEDLTAGSGDNLKAGDIITLEDLLFNAMLPSSNTAATIIARIVGETLTTTGTPVGRFVEAMNNYATQLGMVKTNFKNPTGLSATGFTTTAEDMLKLAKAAAMNNTLKTIWGKPNHTLKITGVEPRNVEITSSVQMVADREKYALGGKTGTLGTTHYNQVSHVKLPKGFTAVVVQLRSKDDEERANDVARIVEYLTKHFDYDTKNSTASFKYSN